MKNNCDYLTVTFNKHSKKLMSEIERLSYVKADGGENCVKQFEVMKKSYQKYEVVFSSF
tara:strand:- start:90 stop:266 length:177 start_codon:yes stop_codon:yes gene_type:complete